MQAGRVPRWLVGLLVAQTMVIVGAMVLLDAARTAPAAPATNAGGIDWSEIARPSTYATAVPPPWTAPPTLRPISLAQLEAFREDGTIPPDWQTNELSRAAFSFRARAALERATDACIAKVLTLEALDAADSHQPHVSASFDADGTFYDDGHVTHAKLRDAVTACRRSGGLR